MPYITVKDRSEIEHGKHPQNDGQLNYFLTRAVDFYLAHNYGKNVNYSAMNGVIGVLECVKQEFYRRIMAAYEDRKRSMNGDVYTCYE